MIQYIRDLIYWVYAERAFLAPLVRKYRDRPGPPPKFDGPALKAYIVRYEPYVWRWYCGESALRVAIAFVRDQYGPHAMTPEEERALHDRTGSPG